MVSRTPGGRGLPIGLIPGALPSDHASRHTLNTTAMRLPSGHSHVALLIAFCSPEMPCRYSRAARPSAILNLVPPHVSLPAARFGAFQRAHPSKFQRPCLLHLWQRAHGGEHVRGQLAVDLDQSHGVAARYIAADVKGRDVDAGVAHYGREAADEAWLVEIGDVDHGGSKPRIHANALDVDNA